MEKTIYRLAAAIACLFGAGCMPVGETWLRNRTATAANDQIMLVRKNPPSFGYERLKTQSVVYPDLAEFVDQRGVPEFLAETNNQDRRYLILYYLERRQAFACRTRAARSRDVEFAGPYPITDSEFRLLDTFKEEAAKRRSVQ